MSSPKIAKYSLSELKNTTDDVLPTYLNSLKFTQSHFLLDVRLALGYTAVTIAAILFYADWKLGWDATKAATFWAVIAYFTINSVLTVWIWLIEKGKVYNGELNGTLLSIASSVTKHTPIYNITVKTNKEGAATETLKLSAPFTRWFDEDGCFVAKPFQQWLASEVSLIGQADPKNKVSSIGNGHGGVSVAEAVVIQQADKSVNAVESEASTPGARSRKGKK